MDNNNFINVDSLNRHKIIVYKFATIGNKQITRHNLFLGFIFLSIENLIKNKTKI